MIKHQGLKDKRMVGKLYNFIEFKKMKPFFLEPIKITIGNQLNDTYYLVENVAYKGMQILAMKQKQDSNTIILVEAKIENGQLIHISKVSEDIFGDISRMLKKTHLIS
jgi:hypothetical protein